MNTSPIVLASVALASVAVILLASCNFITMEQNRLESKFRRLGLTDQTMTLPDGAQLQYWAGGEGPTVLLLHGFGAEAIWQWHHQVKALIKDHRVLVPNLLWFGRSTSPNRDFSLEHQATAVVQFLDQLGEERVDVAGISYGGMVLYMIGAAYPERVGKAVILDSPGLAYSREDYDALLARFEVSDLSRLLVPESTADVQRLIDLAYFKPPVTPEFARKQVLTTLYRDHGPERALLLETAVDSMDELLLRTDELAAETLLIWGAEDPVFPLELGHRLSKRLGARLEVIEKAKHAPNIEHPARVNALLTEFLAVTPSNG